MVADLRVLYRLAAVPIRGRTHAERLESFYAGQAADYDRFRERLLHGRRELWESLPVSAGDVWCDLACGTGAAAEYLGTRLADLQHLYLVDLSRSLLKVARERAAAHGWHNVSAIEADVTRFEPPRGPVDVVTCSYALTMTPDWYAVIDRAWGMLKPGGRIGIVDFYVSRKHPAEGCRRHGWWQRSFWPAWFASDNVFLSPDHLPYLQRRFAGELLCERTGRVPYLAGLRAPYYLFVGRKAG
ncbi:MAG: class I SAM-dependent methyltransferase [Pirellulales bacterium]